MSANEGLKYCNPCERWLPFSEYAKHKNRADGVSVWCLECTRAYGKQHYRKNRKNNFERVWRRRAKAHTDILVFLSIKYENMTSRVKHPPRTKIHLYKNLPICAKDEFIEWALRQPELHALYKDWQDNDFSLPLCPSIDRINSDKGYTTDNMQWLTHAENSQRGAISRHYGVAV